MSTPNPYAYKVNFLLVEDEYGFADPESGDEWYLFNDFSVREIDEEEALSFPGTWKVPTILYFERIDTPLRQNIEVASALLSATQSTPRHGTKTCNVGLGV